MVSGNELMAMGAALAGCSSIARTDEPRDTHTGMVRGPWEGNGICVRQVEDEISVINMSIGAGHMGARACVPPPAAASP